MWFMVRTGSYMINFYVKYVPVYKIFVLMMLAASADILSKFLNGLCLRVLPYKVATIGFALLAIGSGIFYVLFRNV